jgi:hypothetical protein
MIKLNRIVQTYNDVSYIEKNRVIYKLLKAEFSIDEILVNRITACTYEITGIKNL